MPAATLPVESATHFPSIEDFPEFQRWNEILATLVRGYPKRMLDRWKYYYHYRTDVRFNRHERRITVGSPVYPSSNVSLQVTGTSPLQVTLSCPCPHFRKQQKCEHIPGVVESLRSELAAGEDVGWEMLQLAGAAVWRRTLIQIETLVREALPNGKAVAPRVAPPAVRLVFRVDDSEDGIHVHPYELTERAKGGWTKGRRLSWTAFASRRELWNTPAEVALAATELRFYNVGPDEALRHLVGHPSVQWADTCEPLEVRAARLGFGVQSAQGGYLPGLTIDGRFADEFDGVAKGRTGIIATDRLDNQVLIADADARMIKLCDALMECRTPIPADGRDSLLRLLPRLETALPISVPEQLVDRAVDADGRLFLKLTPLPGGLTAELAVRPVEGGAWCVPGEGPAEVTNFRNGQSLLVRRRLPEERAAATALSQELRLPDHPQTGPCRWQIAGDDEALDLLGRVNARPEGDPSVVWSEEAKPRKVVGEIVPANLKFEISSSRDWFGLEGTIDVGGMQVPLQQLLGALRFGRRYVELADGQWAAISEEFRDRLRGLDDVLHRNRNKLEFDVTAAPLIAEFVDDQSLQRAARAWKDTLRKLERAAQLDPHPPAALTAELRDYQVEGYRWLRRLAEWGVGGCLADDMGLGKTVQALAVLIDRRDEGPALVVAPVSVGFNWVREAERFAPTLRPILYRDTDRSEILSGVGPGDLVIVSYGLLLRDAERFQTVKWGTLILDEAQFIKNSRTKTAQVVREIDAGWRVALTGTPLENHLGELWSMYRALSPGLFGAWERFRERFGDPIEKAKNAERRQALARTIRPFILRRTKSEVLTELPQRTEIVRTAELSDEERRRYEDARLWAATHLSGVAEGNDQRFAVLAALTRLRQLACHPRLLDEAWAESSAKLDLFLETIDELRESGHRALVFSQFTSHLAIVREALDARGIAYQYLDGQTPEKQRRDAVDSFQRGQGDLFLISLKAGGTGLNLTAADYVIHLDPWWNPAVEDQATDRAHRIGQTRPVTVYRLVARDTIEEQILALHAEKRTLVSGVLEGSDQAARLSTQELVDLIRGGCAGPARGA